MPPTFNKWGRLTKHRGGIRIRQFNSYKSLFRIDFKIHELGDIKLPIPIPLDALAMTAILFLPMYLMVMVFQPNHPIIIALTLAWVGAYVLSQVDLQGKYMPVFFWSLITYLFQARNTNLYGTKIEKTRKQKLNWEMGEAEFR